MARASELEYLIYLRENMPIGDLCYLAEGFVADTGKQPPEEYAEDVIPEQKEDREAYFMDSDDYDPFSAVEEQELPEDRDY